MFYLIMTYKLILKMITFLDLAIIYYLNFINFILIFVENYIYDALHDFSIGLREPVLTQRTLIGFEFILENLYIFPLKSYLKE